MFYAQRLDTFWTDLVLPNLSFFSDHKKIVGFAISLLLLLLLLPF